MGVCAYEEEGRAAAIIIIPNLEGRNVLNRLGGNIPTWPGRISIQSIMLHPSTWLAGVPYGNHTQILDLQL